MRVREHLRLRSDLTWRRFVTEGQEAYIFKDEITQDYVKLDVISGTLALKLDGRTSPEDLLAFARETWPSLDFDADYIADVIADLRRFKFLEDPFERNALLQARAKEERAQINAATFRNIFSIPLGTVNPDRFLSRTYPYLAWFFSPFFVWLGVALFTLSGYVVWVNRDHVAGPTQALFTGSGFELFGAFLVWITIIVIVVIHELGHGYAVKHFGGKVDRLGFLFMFGLPCMFCNTSDSHLFPNWRHRVCVALAGTYTELYVASFATLVWWVTPSELVINQLAYNIMLFASVGGILFNYNPLIKMDGYFVLADVLDTPNLQEDAYGYFGYLCKRYLAGMRDEPCPVEGRRRKRVLLVYAIASIAYSAIFAFIVFGVFRARLIAMFAFAGALAAVALLVLVIQPLSRPLVQTAEAWVLDHRGWIRRHQLPIVAGVTLLLGAFLLVPVPGRRAFDVAVEPVRAAALVAPEDLTVTRAAWSAGEPVQDRALLAVLDADADAAEQRLAAADAGAYRIGGAEARHAGDALGAVTARAEASGAEERSRLLERRVRRAELRAPFAGRMLTPAPLGREGDQVKAGDTLCTVGDFSAVRATARLWEFDLEDVSVGAPVAVRLRARPGTLLRGRVSAIEPAAETGGGRRVYQVRIALAGPAADTRAGLTGRAWITTPMRAPAAHFARMLARFVRLDLWL
ncbi:MAG: HlyD family efflux transporter periplasmic adaptor subunit [Candidatus Eisenbacteria bacterium]|nr:HlyD family efflux transporter periplasmic adaptor subunit [Candidatus Eisenbacteria bacterium]